MKSYKADFEKWIEDNNIEVFNRLSDVKSDFKSELFAGQTCTFRNEFGVNFEGQTILGFCKMQENMFTGEDTGRYVYLDSDSFWMPIKPKSIILDKKSYSNIQLASSGSKTLIGDISISQVNGKPTSTLENLHINDKSTGLTEPLKTNGIDLSKQPADTVKKLLSGSKVQTNSAGITQMLGLSKTPLGWGITIGKQVFNSADSSAGIG